MIKISLTDFIDFVSKTGSSKMTQVRTVKKREKYHPSKDYYKILREAIVENHKLGADKRNLEKILDTITQKKQLNFELAIKGYQKFWGRRNMEWFEPPFKHWTIDDLDVKINPELGLAIGDTQHVIKLYFKSEKLSKGRIDQILSLLESELRNKVKKGTVFCVLDVRQGRLYCNVERKTELIPLLVGEARSFAAIWNNL